MMRAAAVIAVLSAVSWLAFIGAGTVARWLL
jgi:hypothetical protein